MTTPTATWVVTGAARLAHTRSDGIRYAACGASPDTDGWREAPEELPRCPRCARHVDRATVDAVTDATGATYRQLDFWVRLGYLHPAQAHPGSGSPRTWPPAEIEVARRMAELTTAGLTLAAAHHAARNGGLLPGGRWRVTYEGAVAWVPMRPLPPKPSQVES